MPSSERRTIHRTRARKPRVAGFLVVVAVITAALGHQLPESLSSTASPSSDAGSRIDPVRGEQRGALGEADGAIPGDATVFDHEIPGVARLDADLLGALRHAATDAADEGVTFFVDSGWRSPQYQEHLLNEAISKYGSEAAAARWVASPNTSAHVSGDAADIGHSGARAWLSQHGAAYGLCQIYRNEAWHYELRPDARERGCPPMYADAASAGQRSTR